MYPLPGLAERKVFLLSPPGSARGPDRFCHCWVRCSSLLVLASHYSPSSPVVWLPLILTPPVSSLRSSPLDLVSSPSRRTSVLCSKFLLVVVLFRAFALRLDRLLRSLLVSQRRGLSRSSSYPTCFARDQRPKKLALGRTCLSESWSYWFPIANPRSSRAPDYRRAISSLLKYPLISAS